MASARTTVALGEFDALTEAGLRHVLGEDRRLRLVSLDLDGNGSPRATSSRYQPSVILLDETKVSDLLLLAHVKSSHPNAAVVLLTHHEHTRPQARSRLTGVRYLSRGSTAHELRSAIQLAAEGKGTPQIAALTAREQEVLAHLVAGESYREIAEKLHIGVETVRTHSVRIRHKLGLQKKRDLIGLRLPQVVVG
jgi:DNA-binding NarL/FixJ family response regulator